MGNPERHDQNSWLNGVRETFKALRATHFFSVAGIMVVMLFMASLAMFLVEHQLTSARGLWDSVWWAMVTVTTVGYGDIVPKTVIGRLIAFGIMVAGLVLVSLITASIASVFVSRKIKEGEGLDDVRDRDHFVICGWHPGGFDLVKGLVNQFKPKVPVIVLVNELSRDNAENVMFHFQGIEFRYVRGDFTKEQILARANIRRARAAIVLSDTSGDHPYEKADERTIFACMAIKAMAPKVKTCAELRNPDNREHLVRTQVDEVVVRGEYNSAILAGGASGTGLSTVMKRLLDVEEENRLWRTRIHERFIGRTAGELAEHIRTKYSAILLAVVTENQPLRLEDILSQDATAIDGFIKKKFEESGRDYFSGGKIRVSVQLNPPQDYVLTRHDAAIVLGRTRPGEASILEKSFDLMSGAGRAEGQ